MKTISLQIPDADFNLLGLTKEQMLYSDFKDILERQFVLRAMDNCLKIAKETGLSEMTLEQINAEIKAVRDERKKQKC